MSLMKAKSQRQAESQDASYSPGPTLQCAASGCPNRWSVSVGGAPGLCRAHAWADKHWWPQITQEQLDAETDRARAPREPESEAPRLSKADKRAILEGIRAFSGGTSTQAGRAWAYALQAREVAGERLTPAQRQMWRDALGPVQAATEGEA